MPTTTSSGSDITSSPQRGPGGREPSDTPQSSPLAKSNTAAAAAAAPPTAPLTLPLPSPAALNLALAEMQAVEAAAARAAALGEEPDTLSSRASCDGIDPTSSSPPRAAAPPVVHHPASTPRSSVDDSVPTTAASANPRASAEDSFIDICNLSQEEARQEERRLGGLGLGSDADSGWDASEPDEERLRDFASAAKRSRFLPDTAAGELDIGADVVMQEAGEGDEEEDEDEEEDDAPFAADSPPPLEDPRASKTKGSKANRWKPRSSGWKGSGRGRRPASSPVGAAAAAAAAASPTAVASSAQQQQQTFGLRNWKTAPKGWGCAQGTSERSVNHNEHITKPLEDLVKVGLVVSVGAQHALSYPPPPLSRALSTNASSTSVGAQQRTSSASRTTSRLLASSSAWTTFVWCGRHR